MVIFIALIALFITGLVVAAKDHYQSKIYHKVTHVEFVGTDVKTAKSLGYQEMLMIKQSRKHIGSWQ